MIKKEYHISGFDCANCAAKAEAHLNKDKEINYCRLDFSMNKMYITYENKEWDIKDLKKKIAEVESDPLEIHEAEKGLEKGKKILDKKLIWLLIRIAICTVLLVVTNIALRDDKYYWVNFGLYLGMSLLLLYDVTYKVINHIIHRENILDHNLLITISVVGAFVLASLEHAKGEESMMLLLPHFEAVMVVLLFQVGRIIESIATNKSKAAIMSAVSLRIEYANLVDGHEIRKVQPEELKIGDIILVKNGELIPSDGEITEGEAYIDTSSLTGEYIPVKASAGSPVASGCLIKEGAIRVKVTKKYEDSTVSKIVDLISKGGEKKSKADEFIAKFAKIYTPIIVGLSVLMFGILFLVTKDWEMALYSGLEILVTGCPCAIVISVPLAYFSAIGLSSKNGIVIKGANYLDELCRMGKLITDKTGTLTHGSFSVQKIVTKDMKQDEFMQYLRAVESLSNHPIGKAICHGVDCRKLASEQEEFKEVAGKGVYSVYKDKLLEAGSYAFLKNSGVELEEVHEAGVVVYLSIDNEYVGYVVLSDELKEDAQPMVNLLHSEKVEIILLTGDKEENAKELCTNLGIDRWHSELLPEDKTRLLEEEMNNTNKAVAFIGDGINDAPSIIRSDIGIAMGGIGSDIAVENADIVIMNDDPAKVYDALAIAKKARRVSIFNIAFALAVKAIVAILVAIPAIEISMLIPVIADTGLTVLLVLNSLLLLYRKIKRKNV